MNFFLTAVNLLSMRFFGNSNMKINNINSRVINKERTEQEVETHGGGRKKGKKKWARGYIVCRFTIMSLIFLSTCTTNLSSGG